MHLSVDGHLGCFHVLVIVNHATMNIACIFLNYGFLQIYAQSSIIRSYGNSLFSFFKEPPYCSPYWLYQFTLTPTLFSSPSPAVIICRLFDDVIN